MDKVLSPPKPNNILDYFKKTSVAGENKTLLDADDKDYKSPSKPPLKRKRKGKRVNLNKLREKKESENEQQVEIISDDNRETTRLKQDSNDFIASCTSVDEKCTRELAEDNVQRENFSNDVIYRKNANKVGSKVNGTKSRTRKSRKRKHGVKMDLSESFSSENELNEKWERETEDRNKMVSPTIAECDAAISDSSFEVHTDDKTSQVNNSIITVSFEDFLKSQGENNGADVEGDTKPTADNSATANETDKSDSVGDPEKGEESQQPPLRTVTVLAQVHSIPPKLAALHKEQKGSRKIASIFLKQRSVGEKESSPPPLDSEQTEQVTQKRKSNVVIEEEELELAVLETGGSDYLKPKCTLEERHQFMKAFRQPTADVVKSGVKKAPGKQKQTVGQPSKEKGGPEDGIASNKGLESGEPEDSVGECTHSSARTKTKRPKKFQKKENRRKASETKETNVLNTSSYNEDEDSGSSVLTKENTVDVTISSSPKVNELRRSLRQKNIKTPKSVTPKKIRIRNTFSEDELSGRPLQTSTPKASKRSLKKSNMYKAEVITVPFDGNSPIR